MTKQFEVGKTYSTRSACDYDCIFTFTVTKRTAKTVTVRSNLGEVARKVRVYDGAEHLYPHGIYSMAAIISADKEAA